MSDTEYLNLLSQGRDPVRETLYIQELTAFGFTSDYTQQVAPLFDKPDCTIAEKLLVNTVAWIFWEFWMETWLERNRCDEIFPITSILFWNLLTLMEFDRLPCSRCWPDRGCKSGLIGIKSTKGTQIPAKTNTAKSLIELTLTYLLGLRLLTHRCSRGCALTRCALTRCALTPNLPIGLSLSVQ